MNRHLHAVTAPAGEDLAAHDALNVDCPACGAPVDGYCTNPLTGRHLHGRTSHWQRWAATRSARTETT